MHTTSRSARQVAAEKVAMEAGSSEIIKFQPNIPVRLTLKYGDTKPCKSRFSAEDQYMLSATDGRIAFLTPYANARLQAAGVQRGDEITIEQVVVNRGQRKTIDWRIEKVTEQPAARGAATGPTVAASDMPAKPYQVEQQIGSSSVSSRPATQLEDALRTAMAAAKAAEQYGREIGYLMKFDKDDVRSMAITLLIGKQRGGDRP